MVIVYGTRFYGKVKACGSSFLATHAPYSTDV